MNKSRLMGPLCLPSKEWLDPLGKHVHLVCHKPYPSHLYVLLQAKHGFLLTLFQFSLFVQQLSKKESVFEIQSNYVSLVALEFTVQTRLVSNGEVCLLLTPSVRMKSVYHHTSMKVFIILVIIQGGKMIKSIITAPCLALVGFCSHALDSLALWASRLAPSNLKPNLKMSLSQLYLKLSLPLSPRPQTVLALEFHQATTYCQKRWTSGEKQWELFKLTWFWLPKFNVAHHLLLVEIISSVLLNCLQM